MGPNISQELLGRASEFVAERMCLNFPRERWPDLERGIRSAAAEFGFKDAELCIRWLLSEPLARARAEILARYLTVGETYFFREKETFAFLEESVLPGLIRRRRETGRCLRIWSAGCATGEEPYSVAILLSKLVPDLRNWRLTVLATDINPNFLKKAVAGVYGEWSFRDTPAWVRDGYFRKTKDGHFEVLPAVRKLVTFSYHNLAEDVYPLLLNNTNAMDIIFCRNVLMYFLPEAGVKVIGNFYRCLTDDGWLIVGLSESPHVPSSRFTGVNFSDVTLYRKGGGIDKPAVPPPLPFGFTPEPAAVFSWNTPGFSGDRPENPSPEIEREKSPEPRTDTHREVLALYRQGRYAEAVNRILEPDVLGQADSRTLVLLARAYANQGRLAEARGWCEKAIVMDKLNPGIRYFRATILQEQGLIDEAVRALKQVLYLDRNFALAHFTLGNLARRQNKFKESDRHFKNTLTLLKDYQPEETLPESEGITAGRLAEVIPTNSRLKLE